MQERAVQKDLDRQITATHRRLVKAMDARLPSLTLETKERYFAVLSMLVAKLETSEKTLKEILQEMMFEAGSVILQELQGF
jgi:ATP-dependent Zn protease